MKKELDVPITYGELKNIWDTTCRGDLMLRLLALDLDPTKRKQLGLCACECYRNICTKDNNNRMPDEIARALNAFEQKLKGADNNERARNFANQMFIDRNDSCNMDIAAYCLYLSIADDSGYAGQEGQLLVQMLEFLSGYPLYAEDKFKTAEQEALYGEKYAQYSKLAASVIRKHYPTPPQVSADQTIEYTDRIDVFYESEDEIYDSINAHELSMYDMRTVDISKRHYRYVEIQKKVDTNSIHQVLGIVGVELSFRQAKTVAVRFNVDIEGDGDLPCPEFARSEYSERPQLMSSGAGASEGHTLVIDEGFQHYVGLIITCNEDECKDTQTEEQVSKSIDLAIVYFDEHLSPKLKQLGITAPPLFYVVERWL